MSSRKPSNVVPLRPRPGRGGGRSSSVPSAPSVTEQAEWTIGQALALICTGDLSEVEAATGHSGAIIAVRMGQREEQRMIAAGADPKQGFPVEPPYFNAAWQRLLQDAARETASVATGVWGHETVPTAIPQHLLARATPNFHLDGEDALRIQGGDHFLGEEIRAVRFRSSWCIDTYLAKQRPRRKTKVTDQATVRKRRSKQAELADELISKAEQQGIQLRGLSINDQLSAVAALCDEGQELPGRKLWAERWKANQNQKKSSAQP